MNRFRISRKNQNSTLFVYQLTLYTKAKIKNSGVLDTSKTASNLSTYNNLICSLEKLITGVMHNLANQGAKFGQTVKLAWDVFHYQTVLEIRYSRLHLGELRNRI